MKIIDKKTTIISVILIFLSMVSHNAYAQNNHADIKVTKISELHNYTNSNIKGEVTKILDEDEFRLEDSSGEIKVYTGWKNTNVVKKGETIIVNGKLDPGIIKEFYATEIFKENGEIIKLKQDD